MSEMPPPPDFDYSKRITDEDRALRELVLSKYSESAADHLCEKYGFSYYHDYYRYSWEEYERKVRELVARNLSQSGFVKALNKLYDDLVPPGRRL